MTMTNLSRTGKVEAATSFWYGVGSAASLLPEVLEVTAGHVLPAERRREFEARHFVAASEFAATHTPKEA